MATGRLHVRLKCAIMGLGARIKVEGNKITATEFGDNSLEADCYCPFDFGYEIGPLEQNVEYELTIANSPWGNRPIRFVYTSGLTYKE